MSDKKTTVHEICMGCMKKLIDENTNKALEEVEKSLKCETVLDSGKHTGVLPGKVLRKK